jgi:hypothetical protein
VCGASDEIGLAVGVRPDRRGVLGVAELADEDELLALARHLCEIPEQRSAHLGSIGYGGTREGDRVLVAVDLTYDPDVVGAVVRALRECGATVDVHWQDSGPDRRFAETDELDVTIRREPWTQRPRRWEGDPRIEARAEREGYDLLVHGRGGPTAPTPSATSSCRGWCATTSRPRWSPTRRRSSPSRPS